MIDLDFDFLISLGWGPFFTSQLDPENEPGFLPARVLSEERKRYRLQLSPNLILWGEVTGRIRHEAKSRQDFPAVGDWVICQPQGEGLAVIHRVLARRTLLMRKAAGGRFEEQILAANVDTAFIVTSMNDDFSVRRLDRYLTLVRNGGALPIILLTKADAAENPSAFVEQALAAAPDVAVHAISSKAGTGLQELSQYLGKGSTSVLLGSSGVGKSTLINRILGSEAARTSEIREDDSKGRHTTTSRQLWVSASGALVIDTPGMRELQLWADEDQGLDETFDDIAAIALQCKFTDCKHENEPGCRIRDALGSGEIDRGRYKSYIKLQGELAHQIRKVDKAAASAEKHRWKQLNKDLRTRSRDKGRK